MHKIRANKSETDFNNRTNQSGENRTNAERNETMKTQPIFRTFECNAAKRKLNLQLFAEPAPEVEVHEEPNGSGDDSNPEIDIDALRVQLAQANAQIAKLTNKADALASENAAKTLLKNKKLRQKRKQKLKEKNSLRKCNASYS